MEKCPLLLLHSATFDKSAAEKLEPVKTVPSVFSLSLGDGDLMLPVKTRGKKINTTTQLCLTLRPIPLGYSSCCFDYSKCVMIRSHLWGLFFDTSTLFKHLKTDNDGKSTCQQGNLTDKAATCQSNWPLRAKKQPPKPIMAELIPIFPHTHLLLRAATPPRPHLYLFSCSDEYWPLAETNLRELTADHLNAGLHHLSNAGLGRRHLPTHSPVCHSRHWP